MRMHSNDVTRLDPRTIDPADGSDAAVPRVERQTRMEDFYGETSVPIAPLRAAFDFDRIHVLVLSRSDEFVGARYCRNNWHNSSKIVVRWSPKAERGHGTRRFADVRRSGRFRRRVSRSAPPRRR